MTFLVLITLNFNIVKLYSERLTNLYLVMVTALIICEHSACSEQRVIHEKLTTSHNFSLEDHQV